MSYYKDFCSTYSTTAIKFPIGHFKSALTNWLKNKDLKSIKVPLPTITGGSESIHRKYAYCSISLKLQRKEIIIAKEYHID